MVYKNHFIEEESVRQLSNSKVKLQTSIKWNGWDLYEESSAKSKVGKKWWGKFGDGDMYTLQKKWGFKANSLKKTAGKKRK